MAPRVRAPLREIQYMLSPYQQNVMLEVFKNAPKTLSKWIAEVRGLLLRLHGSPVTRLRCPAVSAPAASPPLMAPP